MPGYPEPLRRPLHEVVSPIPDRQPPLVAGVPLGVRRECCAEADWFGAKSFGDTDAAARQPGSGSLWARIIRRLARGDGGTGP